MKQAFDQILYDTAFSCLNIQYKWGGNHPLEGFDCSGLVCYILHSCGAIKFKKDMSSQALFDHYYDYGHSNYSGLGALTFYGKSIKKITHIGFCIDDDRMIEAAHGGKNIENKTDATEAGAFVRVSPIHRRKDFQAIFMPVYPWRKVI